MAWVVLIGQPFFKFGGADMKKIMLVFASAAILLMALVLPNSASAATTDLTKNENKLRDMAKDSADQMRGMEVIVTKASDSNTYYEEGKDYIVLKNGDKAKNVSTRVGNTYIDLRNGSLDDIYSIKLLRSDVKVASVYYDISVAFTPSGGSFNNRATVSFYKYSEEEYKGFFRGRILGEVQVTKIPQVIVNNLVDGGILSTALIVFAILLGAGLVRRYLSSLSHY